MAEFLWGMTLVIVGLELWHLRKSSGPLQEGKPVQAAQPSVHMRWMVEKDRPRVLEIERQSFDNPWNAKDLSQSLAAKTVIGMVVELEGRVAAFFIYACVTGRLDIYNLAVAPEYRRRGIGRAMIERLKTKLGNQGRYHLMVTISERNLSAQQFYRACGFRAVKVLHDVFDEPDHDGYVFAFSRTPVQIHRESLCQGI